MKRLINRLVCLIRGHKWKRELKREPIIDWDKCVIRQWKTHKYTICTRYGKVKEERI